MRWRRAVCSAISATDRWSGVPGGWLPWTHRAYLRRVIEIRDTIVQLAPYYDPAVVARARSAEFGDTSAIAGQSRAMDVSTHLPEAGAAEARTGVLNQNDPREIRVRAAVTWDALRRKRENRPVEAPYPLPTLGGDDLDSDARWLARLAEELQVLEAQPSSAPLSSSTSSMRNT